jgi:chromosome segregation ATPase
MRALALLLALMMATAPALAADGTEVDRLRDALRAAIAQARSLDDQRVTLQVQLAEASKQRDALKRDVDAAKAAVKKSQAELRQAVSDFNDRLEERNQTLDKWKAAYDDAANVAREKDAERAKFEAEAASFKASTKSCEAKNGALVKVGLDMLDGYRNLDPGKLFAIQEPLIGIGKVGHENQTQDFLDRILDQKAKP